MLAAVLAGAGGCRWVAGYTSPPNDQGASTADGDRRDLVGDSNAADDGPLDGPAIDGPPIDRSVGDISTTDMSMTDAPASDAPPLDGDAVDGIPSLDAAPLDAVLLDAALLDAAQLDGPVVDSSFDTLAADTGADLRADSPSVDQLPAADAGVPPWVFIPAGTFSMGSPSTEPCRDADETLHQVTLTHAFEIQRTEVTKGKFASVLAYNPSASTCGPNCPVTNVNWHEAAAYCNALSMKESLAACYACSGSKANVSCQDATSYANGSIYSCPGYRLPTEAEWEYAYRAGTKTAFYSGAITNCTTDTNAGTIGYYKGNASSPHAVKGKAPNAWDLYDMAGNVSEWCHDRYQSALGASTTTDPWGAKAGANRVFRGGSFTNPADRLRGADRPNERPAKRFISVGFRCVRTR